MKQIILQPQTRKKYRRYLSIALFLSLLGILLLYLWQINYQLPENIILYQNRMEQIDLNLPLVGEITTNHEEITVNGQSSEEAAVVSFSLDERISLTAKQVGNYQADLKLFGVIPYRKLELNVVKEQKVMPAGNAVGIYLESKGIMVLGTAEIRGRDGFIYHPAQDILQEGDYLLKVNGQTAQSIKQVSALLQENRDKEVKLDLQRGNNQIQVKVTPVYTEEGIYQLGIWLREDTEGIGTMTCITEDNHFVALGHGITDVDTGEMIRIQQGGLYPASIRQIIAGKKGNPGELFGSVLLSEKQKIGEVKSNNLWGISGEIAQTEYQYQEEQGIPIALKQEIQTGRAAIRCQIDEEVREYEIEIEDIAINAKDLKGLVLRVTDQELLEKTGGIVQGLSGSPIIQNGKLIGAVTHVFVNDPSHGYGIFIEHMLAE